MSGYYLASPPAQSMAWPSGSDLIPKVTLNAKGSADEPYIDVTIEWGGRPWKTWRWQLKRKGKKLKLVALGEVHASNAVQDYDTSAIPTYVCGTAGAGYSNLWPTPSASSHAVVPNTESRESMCKSTNETSDGECGSYTFAPPSSGTANHYSFHPNGGTWATPRSFGDQ